MSLYGADLLAMLPELIVVVTACLVIAWIPSLRLATRSPGLAESGCPRALSWAHRRADQRTECPGVCVQRSGRHRCLCELLETPPLWRDRPDDSHVAALSESGASHLGEYYGFILLALSGMMVMVSGADLLTIYLGTELMSLSLYVMTGLKRSKPRSLEASAKYFVLGAFSSGILLYGISLLYGLTGSTRLSAIAAPSELAGRTIPSC